MSTILVTGANGQVGSELQYLAAKYPNFKFVWTDATELDITNQDRVKDFFAEHDFDYVLNCAAYTAVDKAESDEDLAIKVNVTGVKNLAEAALRHNAKMIQLSTDYVYHNAQNRPFKEDDETNPQSVYAQTKLDGDLIGLKTNPHCMVIRTSWVYSSFGNNFVKTMIRLGNDRDELGIIFDQIGTPTYARDLADAMLQIVEKIETKTIEASKMSGVYHYSNEGVCSWYDFAIAIFRKENISVKVNAIETKDYPTPAKRPPFSVLNKGKIKATFGLSIPHWETSLINCLKELKKQAVS